jgi:hypothetical protein
MWDVLSNGLEVDGCRRLMKKGRLHRSYSASKRSCRSPRGSSDTAAGQQPCTEANVRACKCDNTAPEAGCVQQPGKKVAKVHQKRALFVEPVVIER